MIRRGCCSAVTPFGLLCDGDRKVTFYFDKAFMGGLAGIHPNDNTATVWLKAEDTNYKASTCLTGVCGAAGREGP